MGEDKKVIGTPQLKMSSKAVATDTAKRLVAVEKELGDLKKKVALLMAAKK